MQYRRLLYKHQANTRFILFWAGKWKFEGDWVRGDENAIWNFTGIFSAPGFDVECPSMIEKGEWVGGGKSHPEIIVSDGCHNGGFTFICKSVKYLNEQSRENHSNNGEPTI